MSDKKLDITAVIVTRGNVDLLPIIHSYPNVFNKVIVWDNSKSKEDLSVYGRYHAASMTTSDLIYVQDDDCIVPVEKLVESWTDEDTLLCNMPSDHGNYTDSALVGWGAIFKRMKPFEAFFRYLEFNPIDDSFFRCCDVVFTTLTPFRRVELGHESLPYAFGGDRMYHQPNHDSERLDVLTKARYVRDFPHPYWPEEKS